MQKPTLLELNGPAPLMIQRDVEGNVTITRKKNDNTPIYYIVENNYSINGKKTTSKPQRYTGTFNLRQGGIVRAYEQGKEWNSTYGEFERIKHILITNVFFLFFIFIFKIITVR